MPEFKLNQDLRITQTQKLALTQKIRQALEILQLPSMDLENIIRKELQENPLLEQGSPDEQQYTDQQEGEGDQYSSDESTWDEEPSRNDDRNDETLEILKKLEEHSGEDSYSGSYRDDDDYWVPEPPDEPTLYEYLLDQVWSLMLPRELEEATVYLVYCLDRHGLLSLPMFELETGWEGNRELLKKALDVVRSLEPTGVGAFSASGALQMQLDKLGYSHESLEYRIVSEHFSQLAERKIKTIAAEEGVSPHEVQQAMDRISVLNPWPGNEFSSSANAAVIPDIIIQDVDHHLEAILNDNRFPHLMISDRNRRILESPDSSDMEKEDRKSVV